MSTVNDNDLFIVERSGTLYKLRHEDMSTLNDTDLFVVERSGTLYKVAAEDVDLGPTGSTSTPVTVLTPVNGSGLNDGQDIQPLSSAITNVAGSGTITVPTAEITAATVLNFSDNTAPDDDTNYRSGAAENIYDSSHTPAKTSNMIFANPGGSWQAKLVTTFNPPLQVNSSLKIMVYKANSYGYYYTLNGGADTSQTALRDTGTSVADGIWEIRDPVNTSDAFTGELTSFSWGLNTGYAGAGNTYWSAIYVDGLRITDGFTTLTHSSNTNLSNFTLGTSVTQNSGYTPETSAITAVGSKQYVTNATATDVPGATGFPGTPNTIIDPDASSGRFDYASQQIGNLFDGSTSTYCYHVGTAQGVDSYAFELANNGIRPGDTFGIYNAPGSTPPSYQPWSIQFQQSNGTTVGPIKHLQDTSGGGWSDFTVPTGATKIRIFRHLLNSSYCQSYIYGFRVNQGPMLTNTARTSLTLTDNTDLENFRVGDSVVDPAGYSDPVITNFQISGTTDLSSFVTTWNSANNSFNVQHIAATQTGDTITFFIPSAATFALGGGRWSGTDISFNVTGDFSSGDSSFTWSSATVTKSWVFNSAGYLTLTTTNASPGFYLTPQYTRYGGSNFDFGIPPVVTGVGSSSIDVDSGTWTNGNTVEGSSLAAATGTVAFTDGTKLTLSSTSGRWITNANKTATKSSSYDTALTFADDTNLNLIIGTATQSNSNATDFDGVTTSAITNVSVQTIPAYQYSSTNSYTNARTYYQTLDPPTKLFEDNNNNFSPENLASGDYGATMTFNVTGVTKVSLQYRNSPSDLTMVITDTSGATQTFYPSDGVNSKHDFTLSGPTDIDTIYWFSYTGSNSTGAAYFSLQRLWFNDVRVTESSTSSTGDTNLTLTDSTNLSSITAGDQVLKGKTVTLDESASNFYALYRDNGNQVSSGTQAVAITQNFFSSDETSSSKNGNVGWLLPTPNTNKLVFDYVVENVGDTIEFIYGSAHIGSATMGFSFSGDCTSATASFTGTKNTSPKSSTNIVTTKKVGTITATLTGPSQAFVHYIEGLENSPITVSSVDTSNFVVAVSAGTWSNGQSIYTYFTPATIGSVELASGSTLYGSSVSGTFLQGKYLRGATVTAEAPSPSEIVFTSSNAGTTAYSGTDSTLTSRTWKLESGSSSTGPWSLVGNYIDTGVASSQDGATQWTTAPTLTANTFYRVGVTYVASNAADVASSNNIFKTGDA